MRLALLHALGRDAPERGIEIELGPARRHRLARPAQREPHQPEGGQRLVPAAVARHVTQQTPDLVRLQRPLVLGLVGRQCATHRIDRIAVNPQRGHGQLKHPGHAALGLGGHARAVLMGGGGEHVQDVHGCDLLDRQRPDLAEHHPLQHVEAARLGDLLPVLQGQPFAGDRLESRGAVLVAAQARQLAIVGRVDALLDEVTRPGALVTGLGKGPFFGVANGPYPRRYPLSDRLATVPGGILRIIDYIKINNLRFRGGPARTAKIRPDRQTLKRKSA
jgi:hypothetical protein